MWKLHPHRWMSSGLVRVRGASALGIVHRENLLLYHSPLWLQTKYLTWLPVNTKIILINIFTEDIRESVRAIIFTMPQ